MSGRDYRTFVTFHRAEEMDKLARRMTDGVGSNKYNNVDYTKLKMKMAEKKFSGHKTLLKVQKLEEISKQNKQNNINKQHRIIWQKEFLHLNQLRKKVQVDLDAHIRENIDTPLCHQMYQDFEYHKAGLESDFEKFRLDTAVPVWNLREDLAYWMSENREDLDLGVPSVIQKHQEIMCTIDNVKQQQAGIVDKLSLERNTLESELRSEELRSLCPPTLERRPHFQDGIPEEAFDLDCPNKELKLKILEEFLLLDQKYHTRLALLDHWHEPVLRKDAFGDWNEDDHFTFVAIFDQYPNELPNRRSLVLNRLKRHLPSYTKSHLIEHEDWWIGYKYYNERQKAIYSDWLRDRRELLTKARVIFAEVCAAHELEELQAENRHKQKELCELLYNKVCEWRNQKVEAMQLEVQFEEQRLKEMEEWWRSADLRERNRRQEEKQMLDAFHEELEKKRKMEEERDRQRLADLHQHLTEQAMIDRERVKYREDQMQLKMEERERMREEKLADELERERRLEVLREQVRVIAESDPDRMMKGTEAWNAHVTEDENEYLSIQKPLFEVNTFTSNQITADHRVRLEQQLRDAGLHTSAYARHVMSQAKPPTVPRPDMQSTVFNTESNTS